MLSRLLVILVLVLQPIAGLAVVAPAESESCVPAGCCCGPAAACEAVGSMMSCGCAAPGEAPATPTAPTPEQTTVLLSLTPGAGLAPVAAIGSHPSTGAPAWAASTGRTHNERQALLCTWRT